MFLVFVSFCLYGNMDLCTRVYAHPLSVEGPTHFYRGGQEVRITAHANSSTIDNPFVEPRTLEGRSSIAPITDELSIDLRPDRSRLERHQQRAQFGARTRAAKHHVTNSTSPQTPTITHPNTIIDSDARAENRTLLPSVLLKYQHLADAGWKVVSLPHFVWRACRTAQSRKLLLSSLDSRLAKICK